MRIAALAVVAWLIATAALAQDLRLEVMVPETIDEHELCLVEIDTNAKFSSVTIMQSLFESVDCYKLEPLKDDPRQRFVWTGKPGAYRVEVNAYDPEMGMAKQFKKVVIGKVTPVPDDEDEDEDEGEDDDPPTPPTPTDAPFETPGFTVFIIKEAGEIAPLTEEQKAIFTNLEIRDYCMGRCVKLDDGYPALRMWDDDYTDSQLRETPDVLRAAYREVLKQANGNLPWIAISDGKTGVSQPLPATVEETLTLLKKYGGT